MLFRSVSQSRYDDNLQVIKDLDYYKNVKGFDCNDKNLEEKLFEYIEAIQEF